MIFQFSLQYHYGNFHIYGSTKKQPLNLGELTRLLDLQSMRIADTEVLNICSVQTICLAQNSLQRHIPSPARGLQER